MNTYYIHNGNESSGPFGLEELKNKKITHTTPVWCQGMEDWKNAGEVTELKSILMIVPPPIKIVSPEPKAPKEVKNHTVLGIKKSYFFLASGLFVLIIGTLIFNVAQENRRADLEQKNSVTEKDNQQYLLQQKEIEEQKQQLAEQERIEAERITRERKETITSRLSEIKKTLADDYYNFEILKDKLIDVSGFKFFRTPDERNEEINLIQNHIQTLKNEIEKLEEESNQLNLELERIH
ncbi:GYF domain-containing protein [Flavobacterium sp. W1B]|uniref:GYF domain-containing protein n=1 Tax=Flavobacterium sp. W1B TaxID=3394146 RepID=UPI0039BCE97C